MILDPRTGRALYQHNANLPLIPASTIKVIVAAAALHDLGAGYRFMTTLVTDGSVKGDQLVGNLWLLGSGDPELTSDNLRAAAQRLKASGIRHVSGNVYADGSAFGLESANKTWSSDDLQYGYAALPSAVSIDGGTAQFTITPDPAGGKASVAVDPPDAAGTIQGSVGTAPAGGYNSLQIDPLSGGAGFTLSGSIPYGAPQKFWRSVTHPTLSAASAVRALLVRDGIEVGGIAASGKAPAKGRVLWAHRSRALSDIVKRMAFDSDNHFAEQLLCAEGRHQFGVGTLANGIAAEWSFLRRLGVTDSALVLADGSGLSDADRITAGALGAVLRSMIAGPDAARVASLLPRIGVEGTPRFRLVDADVKGRILGKDGYIDGASGLAGYVMTAHHGVLVYAFLVDNWRSLDAIWRKEDEVLAQLSRR